MRTLTANETDQVAGQGFFAVPLVLAAPKIGAAIWTAVKVTAVAVGAGFAAQTGANLSDKMFESDPAPAPACPAGKWEISARAYRGGKRPPRYASDDSRHTNEEVHYRRPVHDCIEFAKVGGLHGDSFATEYA